LRQFQELRFVLRVDVNLAITEQNRYLAQNVVVTQFSEAFNNRSDIWAAGAVLYEMATGQRPFPERHLPQLIDDILHRPVKPPTLVHTGITVGLESIILKALDKDPDRRYQSARELRVDLNRLQPTTSGAGTNFAIGVRSPLNSKRKETAIVAVVAFAILLAFVIWKWRNRIQAVSHAPRILAVLPFKALSGDDATAALGAGMTETLTAKLAQYGNRDSLQLVSTREIEAQGITSAEQARREFGVDLALDSLETVCNVDTRTSLALPAPAFPQRRMQGRTSRVSRRSPDFYVAIKTGI
jgi:hypothetical protein